MDVGKYKIVLSEKAENTLKPSVPITDKSDNIGVRDTGQLCHNQGQPTESGENES